MKKVFSFMIICCVSFAVFSCSKKTVPRVTNASSKSASKNTADSIAAKNSAALTKSKAPVPKVIVVNDVAAQKTVDGRYYYDLNGKRYWRNNRDGKYYLFNKSMYNNPDFKTKP